MTTLALGYIKVQKTLQNKVNSIDIPVVNWKKVCYVGFFTSLALLVFYAWQINDLTRGFYAINSYEKQIGKLSEEKKNLEISFAENSFLGEALSKVHALNFQKTTSVKYIHILNNSVEVAANTKK